jgi:phenylacetic acid degradation operon negative regulatory protein
MLHFVIAMINARTTPPTAPPRDRAPAAADPAGPVGPAVVDDGGLRPLSPRSVVLSVLLGQHPPAMAVGRLLEFTSLFGIADGAVRTALSRLVAAGDLHADDGVYRLSDRLLVRQAEQDVGRTRTPSTWDGDWWFVVALADRRSVTERRTFRARVIGARLGELRPDIWVRPANLPANLPVDLDLPDVLVTRGPLVAGEPVDLVDRLWDLDALDERARQLIAPLDAALPDLESSNAARGIPPAFTALAAAQRFLRTEPRLPPALSARPHADELRQRYAAVARGFQSALDAFFD